MKACNTLSKVFPPRELPIDVRSQVDDIAPYRVLVTCNHDGEYEISRIHDSDALPDDAPSYIISVSSVLTGVYPSETATMFALALFGLMPELRGRTCLCVDGNEISASLLASVLEEHKTVLLYADDAEIINIIGTLVKPNALQLTYRRQVVWNDDIPREWANRLTEEEYFRKYNLMISRTRQAIADTTSDKSPYYNSTAKYDVSKLSEIVRSLTCGYMPSAFEAKPETPAFALSPIEQFVEQNVSFSRVEPVLASTTTPGPDSETLKDVATIWREVVFKEARPHAAALPELPLDEIASEHAIDTYVDALLNGVPVEDLLA